MTTEVKYNIIIIKVYIAGADTGFLSGREFFPKAEGRGRGVGLRPTERRRRKIFWGVNWILQHFKLKVCE